MVNTILLYGFSHNNRVGFTKACSNLPLVSPHDSQIAELPVEDPQHYKMLKHPRPLQCLVLADELLSARNRYSDE